MQLLQTILEEPPEDPPDITDHQALSSRIHKHLWGRRLSSNSTSPKLHRLVCSLLSTCRFVVASQNAEPQCRLYLASTSWKQ